MMENVDDRIALIDEFRRFPDELAQLIADLGAEQLTQRPIQDEWSVAQNIHHVADSHMNSYVRCKLMATEFNPTFRPYDEKLWAELPDGSDPDIAMSLRLLQALHARWVRFWEQLDEDGWRRTGTHPESGPVTLEDQLRLYVSHGRAHLAQIQRVLAAQGARS